MIVQLSKGQQITLPASIRKELGLEPGMQFDVESKGGSIIFTPVKEKTWDELFAEADKYPCNLSPEELDEIEFY